MKIRQGFVSNSSSSSFLVECIPWLYPEKRVITKEQEKKLIKYGFKKTSLSNAAAIENDPDWFEKEVKREDSYNYGFNVSCNQHDVINFLTKHRIPFKADEHYSHYSLIYNGGDTYFRIPNFGNMVAMYGNENPKEHILECISDDKLIDEILIQDIVDSFNKKSKKTKKTQKKGK